MQSIWSNTLTMDWVEGDVSHVRCPYSTDWRTMPYAMVARWTGGCVQWETEHEQVWIDDGDTLVAPAGLRHRVTTPLQGWVTCAWAHIQIRVLGHIDLLELLGVPWRITGVRAERLGQLCAELANMSPDPDDIWASVQHLTRCSHMLEILLECVQPQDTNRMLERSALRLVPVLTQIHSRYADAWTRDALAQIAGLSPSQFHTVFRDVMGVSPMDYVLSVRLRHAQEQLLRSSDSISDIAAAVGYHDPFHFSRLFKARFGLSPTAYRQQVQESLTRMAQCDRGSAEAGPYQEATDDT